MLCTYDGVGERFTVWKSKELTRGFKASVIAFVVFGLMIRTERPVLLRVCSIIVDVSYTGMILLGLLCC